MDESLPPLSPGRGPPWLRPELVGSPRWVVAMVTFLLGPGIIGGLVYGVTHVKGDFVHLLGDRFMVASCAIDSSLLGLFLLALHGRHWRPEDLRIRIGWRSTALALGLLVATYLLLVLVMVPLALAALRWPHSGLALLLPQETFPPRGTVHITWLVLVVFTFVNAFYEETVYMSFAFNQMAARMGPRGALAATVVIRVSVHLYQGPGHLLQIGLWAAIFGLAYIWTRKVWPLVLAHATIDFISFGVLKIVCGN